MYLTTSEFAADALKYKTRSILTSRLQRSREIDADYISYKGMQVTTYTRTKGERGTERHSDSETSKERRGDWYNENAKI